MTIAERWVRDMRARYGHLHANKEKDCWVFQFSDGKERVPLEDLDRIKLEIVAEQDKPWPPLSVEEMDEMLGMV